MRLLEKQSSRSVRLFGIALIATVLLVSPPVDAHIVVQGPPGFQAEVEDCLEKIMAAGGTAAANVNQLLASGNVHTIKPGTGYGQTDPNSWGNATNGTGTGSTTSWDPSCTDKFIGDTTANEKCANLAHELTHAADCDKGTVDLSPGHNGIIEAEIKACKVENEYRANKGLDKRNKYGGKDLP